MPKQNYLRVISAKDLGRLNLPDFCPRCFWLERHYGKPPAIFPSIFSIIDSITKKGVARSFVENERLPPWLPIEDVIEVETGDILLKLPVAFGNWILSGRPDDIFRMKDNSYQVVDYKTAKFTGRQDELFPLYEVQLNSYALLAEAYGFKPVSRLCLVYYEPDEELSDYNKFSLGFSPKILEVDLKQEIVGRLLVRAREILDSPLPDSFFDCRGICSWVGLVAKKIKI